MFIFSHIPLLLLEISIKSQNAFPHILVLNFISLGNNISRQLSTDSVSSLNSLSSACSASSSAQQSEADKKKKRGWVRPNISVCYLN